jgi:hypothetical protein
MSNSKITTPACDSDSMSYYVNTRGTIQGLDKLIASTIHQSVTMITASLTLGVLLYEKIANPSHAAILALLLTAIAFIITFNVQRRIMFYSDMLTQAIGVADKLENYLISDEHVKLTRQIEQEVPISKIGGVDIYLLSTKIFYAIEAILFLYFSVDTVRRALTG